MNDNIILGVDAKSGRLVRAARSLFGHVHMRGKTGAGKTSLAMLNFISQFMAPYLLLGKTCIDPIVILDFGGDQNLFWNACELATRCGRVFRYLILDEHYDSFFFPPFQAVPGGKSNIIRIVQMLIQAFHLDNGLIYGGSYYTASNTGALLRVARRIAGLVGSPTLDDVAAYLDAPANRREFKDADQIRMTFDFLLEYPQLAPGPNPDREILLERAIDNGECIYIYVPTLDEPLTARLVGGLVLYSLIHIAMKRLRSGKPRRNIRVFADEWHEVAGRSLAALLAQSRKFLLSFFLANQSTSQLDHRDASLVDAVFEGTFLKQYFTCVGERDMRDLQGLSNDTTVTLGGTSTGKLTGSSSSREIIVPRLSRDQIREATHRFGESFVVIDDGQGHREPILIRQSHAFPDYSDRPLPTRPPQDAVFTGQVGRTTADGAVPLTDPERQVRHAALRKIISAKLAAEAWRSLPAA